MNTKILELWKKAWTPPDRRPASQWIHENVSIEGSHFDFELHPWLVEPADALSDFRTWLMMFIAVTQCGKSRLMEAAAAYWLSEDPGSITAYASSNDKASKWGEERFIPLVKNCKKLEKYLPEDRHKIRKDYIMMTHAVLEVVGANDTNTQSISRRYVLGDEAWQWNSGIIDNAIRRTSALTFAGRRKVFLASTAWDSDSDLEKLVSIAEQRIWHSKCPGCGKHHAFVLSKDKQRRLPENWPMFTLEWLANDITQPGGQWCMEEVEKTAYLKCASCGFNITNNMTNHAYLRSEGKFLTVRNPGAERKVWLINGLAVGGNSDSHYNWGKLCVRFLQAQQLAKQGQLENLKEVLTKDFCEPWADEEDYSRKINVKGGYTFEPNAAGGLWIPPDKALPNSIRLMSVDHQATDPAFYFIVRDWVVQTGESQLVEAGTAVAWEEVEAISLRHGLDKLQRSVYVDAGHDPAEVWLHCSENHWFALRGADRDTYAHKYIVADGTARTIYKPYSPAIKRQPGYANGGKTRMGIYAFERIWGNLPIKDILSRLLAGRGAPWGVPTNPPIGYLEHMNSEIKKKIGNDWRYVQIGNKPNHWWDCEAMNIVGAMVMGALQPATAIVDIPTPTE